MFNKVLIWIAMGTAAATWLGACGLLFLAASFQGHPIWLSQTIQTLFYLTCLIGAPFWAFYSFRWKHIPLGFIFSSVIVLYLTNLTFIILKVSTPASFFFGFDLFVLISITVFGVKGWDRFKELALS